MAYNELVKNFETIREYVRAFYVHGYKSRSEYNGKSSQLYDEERRRLEGWLSPYMESVSTPSGKKDVFIG